MKITYYYSGFTMQGEDARDNLWIADFVKYITKCKNKGFAVRDESGNQVEIEDIELNASGELDNLDIPCELIFGNL